MRVEIIDERRQRFNGLTYHRNGWGYFIYKSRPLHRVVWEYHNGKIPKGYDIHHIDGDKSNNQIENLQCLTRKEHRRLHVEMDRANGLIATPAKKYFICQKCGKEFSSTLDDPKFCYACRAKPKPEHVVKPFKPRSFRTCIACGKPFLLTPEKRRGQHRTCSPQCHAKVYPAPIPEKICPICGKLFKGVHSSQKTCSVECGIKFNVMHRKPIGEKIERVISKCEFCGKEIRHRITQHPRFCSQKCVMAFMHSVRHKS